MDQQHQQTIDTVVRILKKCNSVLFITGAGISADSGMPTYRGIGGLYDIELTEEGFPIEEVLSGTMFHSNPELTWKYLGQIAEAAYGASFNRAHEVIAEMERHFPRLWTLTQNVDGFHRQAGSQNVIEIHGDMRTLLCKKCTFQKNVDESSVMEIPPRCPSCDAILRPDVVLFGEMLPEDAVRHLHRESQIGFGVVISIGTSGVFPYIQSPFIAAHRMGIPTIEINPSETVLSAHADYRIPLGAAHTMNELWKQFSQNDSDKTV